MPIQLTSEQRLRNQVDTLVAVILDGYEPHKILREYADELGPRDRRDVFKRAAKKGIDLRTARERRTAGIGRIRRKPPFHPMDLLIQSIP